MATAPFIKLLGIAVAVLLFLQLSSFSTLQRFHVFESNLVLDSPSALSSTPSWYADATTVQEQTTGTITLHNVCVQRQQQAVKIFSHGPISGHNGTNAGLPDNVEKLMKNLNLEQWKLLHQKHKNGSSLSTVTYVPQDTIWIDLCRYCTNVGHCLNDLTFSISMGMLSKSNSNIGETGATITKAPFYPRYIYANSTYIHSNCSGSCCAMLDERFGIIDRNSIVTTSHDDDIICFRSLVFPYMEKLRHPPPTIETNLALQQLQNRAFDLLHLEYRPWTSPSNNEEAQQQRKGQQQLLPTSTKRPTVLLFDRSDATSRVLVNASVIKQQLELLYDVQVDLWGKDEWKHHEKNATRQAQIFNSYQYILSPHGAQLVNLMHSRPGTKVVEIQCSTGGNRRWMWHQQWFADWVKPESVGIHLRVYLEIEGCKDEYGRISPTYSPPQVSITNISDLVAIAAEHFELQRKES